MHNASVFISHFERLRRTKSLNENRDISLRAVAREAGLSFATVQRIRNGDMERVYLSTLEALCRYFHVKNVNDLIEFRDEPSPPMQGRRVKGQTAGEGEEGG